MQGKKQTTGYAKLKEDKPATKPENKAGSTTSNFFSRHKEKADAKAQFLEKYKDVAAAIHKNAFVYYKGVDNLPRKAPPLAKEPVVLAGDNIKIISKNEIGPERAESFYKQALRGLGMDTTGLKVTYKGQTFGDGLLEVSIPKRTVDAYLDKQAQKQQDIAPPKHGNSGGAE